MRVSTGTCLERTSGTIRLALTMSSAMLVFLFIQSCRAAILVNRGDLSTVNSTMAISGMSGESSEVWFQLFTNGSNDFMRYMVDNETGDLSSTRAASVAEYTKIRNVRGLGKLNTLIWMLAFSCRDGYQCQSLSPLIIPPVSQDLNSSFHLYQVRKIVFKFADTGTIDTNGITADIFQPESATNPGFSRGRNISLEKCGYKSRSVSRRPVDGVHMRLDNTKLDGCYRYNGFDDDKVLVLGHAAREPKDNQMYQALLVELQGDRPKSPGWDRQSVEKCLDNITARIIKLEGEYSYLLCSPSLGENATICVEQSSSCGDCYQWRQTLAMIKQYGSRNFSSFEVIQADAYGTNNIGTSCYKFDDELVDGATLDLVLVRAEAEYVEQQRAAFDTDNGQAVNNLTATITILASFISVIAATSPLTKLQLKVIKRMFSHQKKSWLVIGLVMLFNVVLTLLCYYPVLLLALDEQQRQEEYRTWSLVAQPVSFSLGNPAQALLFVQATSKYTSPMLPLAWILFALSPPIVAAITFQKWLKMQKSTSGLTNELTRIQTFPAARFDRNR